MELKDATGKRIGTIQKSSSGRLEARDATGKIVGTYDPKADLTRDATGKTVGRGDHLSHLLQR